MLIIAVMKTGISGLFFVKPGVKVNSKCNGMFFYRSKCYLLLDMLWMTILSFSRTAHLRIGHMTQWNSCNVKHLISFLQSYGPQQSGPEPRWLLDLGESAAACVRDADPQCWWTQAATGWCLERSAAWLLMLLSASGESIRMHAVFAHREDTLNICCRLFW